MPALCRQYSQVSEQNIYMSVEDPVNSLFPGRCGSDFKSWHLWKCHQVYATEQLWWYANIGLGNGLLPSGNKPLPELMLTQMYIPIWMASVGHNECMLLDIKFDAKGMTQFYAHINHQGPDSI